MRISPDRPHKARATRVREDLRQDSVASSRAVPREQSIDGCIRKQFCYFQGHPGAKPAAEIQGRILYLGGKPVEPSPALPPGKLNALDLDTRAILWSFSRPTPRPNWPFGFVTPVEGGLWVDSYQALVKLP